MPGFIKTYWGLLKDAAKEFVDDNVMKLSASLAYYTVFSLGPLLLVIVSVAGLFFDTAAVTWKVYWQINDLVGQNSADQVIRIIQNMQDSNAGTFSIIGLVILLFGATTVFVDIQDSINYIWSIKAKPEKGWLKFLKNRFLSFSMVLGIGFLLIVSLLVNTVVDFFTDNLFQHVHADLVILVKAFNLLFLFAIITFLFAAIYKLLPNAFIRWKDALKGAVFTGLLFMIGKFLISLYIGSSNMSNTYGAAGSIVVILVWVYYTAVILYFGAEFTKVYALQLGGRIKPYRNATFVVKKEKEIAAM